MAKTKRKWIRLNPSDPDALMAQHIYVNSTETIASKLDNHENRIVTLEGIEYRTVAVSDNDTTPNYLQNKIIAGTNVTVDVINEGGNEQVRISASGTGAGGDPVRAIDVSEFVLDDTATGVDSGKAFNMIDTVDFNQDIDGAVWATVRPITGWDVTQPVQLNLLGVFNGTATGTEVVKLQAQVWETAIGGSPISVLDSPIDVTLSDTDTGVLKNTGGLSFNISSTSSLITVKITRLASDAGDTFGGTYQLVKVLLTGSFSTGG